MTENRRSFSRKYTMLLPKINRSLDSGLQTSDFCNEPKDGTFYELTVTATIFRVTVAGFFVTRVTKF